MQAHAQLHKATMRFSGTLLLSVALTIGVVGTLAQPQPQRAEATGSFLETFTGSPSSPTPWHPSNFDVTVSSRDVGTFENLSAMHAGHGSDCAAPPADHVVTAYADAVFQCKDHVMTAIKGEGYAVVYLTPNQLVDFTNGEAVVRFDVSTQRTSLRDFLDFWITPFDDNVQLAGDIGVVDLNGYPRNAVNIRQDQFNNNTTIYRGNVIRNFGAQMVGSNDFMSVESLLTPSATVRTTFELRVSRTTLKFGIPSLNKWWVDSSFADLGWTKGVLQLGHHSYNPEKDCATCTANTWHWDNLYISSATPFTMLNASRRAANPSDAGPMTFAAPAPANSRLRFTGIGKNLQVSFNGGPWQAAQRQAYSQQLGEEHFDSYWMPVPAGTQTVQFRGTNWFAGSWIVQNVAIWATDTAAAPAPTFAPTSAPTAAPTSAPTAARTVAPTPAPTAAPTAAPTSAPLPTLPPSTGAPGVGSTVAWNGGSYYLHGANVPWVNWGCDFGCAANSGVSDPSVKALVDAKFASAAAAGMHSIRWWTFEGNPWQIRTDANGTPVAVDAAVYADFDAAMALANKYDLYYDFVLFSGPTAVPTAWLTDATKRAALANALAPLFQRYGTNPRVLSWEIFNEPEFDIWGAKIDQASVQATVRAIGAAVHANGRAYVTVGSAYLDGLSMWTGQGLDYYQAHWYDYMSSGDFCAICTDYAAVRAKYGLDHPLVIGELYVGTDTPGRFATFYQKGYAGAWSWSLFPDKTSDHLVTDLAQATSFAAARSNLGPRAALPPDPFPTLAPTAVPTAAPTAAPTSAPTVAPSRTPTPQLTGAPGPTSAPTGGQTAGPQPTAAPALSGGPAPVPGVGGVSQPPVAAVPPGRQGPAGPATAAPVTLTALTPSLHAKTADSFHARWFDQSTYPAMVPGEIRTVTMRFRNTGVAPWVKGVVGEQANLGVYGEDRPYVYRSADDLFRAIAGDPASGMSFDSTATSRPSPTATQVWGMLNIGWPTADRVAIQQEDVVPPGAIGTFTFRVRAPTEPGSYLLRLRPVIDGTVWMEDEGAFLVVTTMADYHSAWVSQSAYPTLRMGSTSDLITVTFKNTGTLSWLRGRDGRQLNLGVAENAQVWSASSVGWPIFDRVAIQNEDEVKPGQTATFSFQVRAPAKPGTYQLKLRPVVDGATWLDDQGVFVTIVVIP
jgi:hypothetical protein